MLVRLSRSTLVIIIISDQSTIQRSYMYRILMRSVKQLVYSHRTHTNYPPIGILLHTGLLSNGVIIPWACY